MQGIGLNCGDTSRAIKWESNRHCCDWEICGSEGVGDPNPDLVAANRGVYGLADCCVHKDRSTLVLMNGQPFTFNLSYSELTYGAGGRFAGSVSCGIDAHVSTQWPSCRFRSRFPSALQKTANRAVTATIQLRLLTVILTKMSNEQGTQSNICHWGEQIHLNNPNFSP